MTIFEVSQGILGSMYTVSDMVIEWDYGLCDIDMVWYCVVSGRKMVLVCQ